MRGRRRVQPASRPAAAAEPVAEAPVQRPAYPVSSYYETARQQAWHEPVPRVEYAPHPDEDFEPAPVQRLAGSRSRSEGGFAGDSICAGSGGCGAYSGGVAGVG